MGQNRVGTDDIPLLSYLIEHLCVHALLGTEDFYDNLLRPKVFSASDSRAVKVLDPVVTEDEPPASAAELLGRSVIDEDVDRVLLVVLEVFKVGDGEFQVYELRDRTGRLRRIVIDLE